MLNKFNAYIGSGNISTEFTLSEFLNDEADYYSRNQIVIPILIKNNDTISTYGYLGTFTTDKVFKFYNISKISLGSLARNTISTDNRLLTILSNNENVLLRDARTEIGIPDADYGYYFSFNGDIHGEYSPIAAKPSPILRTFYIFGNIVNNNLNITGITNFQNPYLYEIKLQDDTVLYAVSTNSTITIDDFISSGANISDCSLLGEYICYYDNIQYTIENVIVVGREIENLSIHPYLYHAYRGEDVQYKCYAKYTDGTSSILDNVNWYIGDNEDTTSTEFDGNTVTNDGLLSISKNTSISELVIKALYNNTSTSTRVYITNNPNPYDKGGNTSGIGSGVGGDGSYGGGTFGGGGQSSSDNISGSLPTGSTEVQDASTGLFTRYLCTPQFLNVLGEWLWTTDLGLAIAKAAISLFYSDPAESIISLMSFPFALSTMTGFNSVSQNFYWGNFDAGFQGTAVKSSAVQMDWGSLKIDEYWGNFLDYAPHTKVELYLPWSTGFVELDATQVVGRTISIKTNIDLNKGSCVHNVYDDLGSVIGSYSGQCGKQLPITASDFASKLASITTAAVGTAVAATVSAGSGVVNATGGEIIPFKIAGGDQGLMRQPRQFNVESAKSTMQRTVKPAIASAAATALRPAHISRNGSFSDGSAGMGVQYPYIIVSRPTQSVPEEYGHHYGYPSNIYQRLQYLSGYTEIGEIHLKGIPCTDSELNELDRILKGGVLF